MKRTLLFGLCVFGALCLDAQNETKVSRNAKQASLTVGQLQFKSGTLDLQGILSTETKTGTLEVVNNGTTPAEVHFENVPKHLSITVEPAIIPAGAGAAVKCTYDAVKKKDFGLTMDEIAVKVKDSKKTLKITANIEEDFSRLSQAELDRAPVLKTNTKHNSHLFPTGTKKGEKVTGKFDITNAGKTDLIIRKITNDSPYLKSSIGAMIVKPGKTTVLTLELTATESGGRFYGTTVVTNAPKQRETIFYLTGVID